MKNTRRFTVMGLGLLAGLSVLGGCSSKADPMLTYTGSHNQPPYTPNFFDARVSAIQYFEGTRTAMVEGNSPLTANTYMMTPAQRQAIYELKQQRELQKELNW